MPNTVTHIGDKAFYEVPLTSVTLSESLISIGSYAFVETKLKSITFPSSLTSIGSSAFSHNDSLKIVTFEEGAKLEEIAEKTFAYCMKLKEVKLPASVSIIGSNAFLNCYISKVSFENNSMLRSIDSGAFDGGNAHVKVFDASNCMRLSSLSSDCFDSVETILCSAVYPPKVVASTFGSGRTYIDLYVPANSIEKYRNADYWKDVEIILPIEEYKEEN